MNHADPLAAAQRFDDIDKIARQQRLEKFSAGSEYINFVEIVPGEARSVIEAQIAKIK